MIRLALLLTSALISIGLFYAFGAWVLLALFAVMLVALLVSTRSMGEAAPARDFANTGYHSTMAARL